MPRLVSGLAPHVIVGVAAGGGHSLFLTARGECFGAGANEAGQLGADRGECGGWGDGSAAGGTDGAEGGGCALPRPLLLAR